MSSIRIGIAQLIHPGDRAWSPKLSTSTFGVGLNIEDETAYNIYIYVKYIHIYTIYNDYIYNDYIYIYILYIYIHLYIYIYIHIIYTYIHIIYIYISYIYISTYHKYIYIICVCVDIQLSCLLSVKHRIFYHHQDSVQLPWLRPRPPNIVLEQLVPSAVEQPNVPGTVSWRQKKGTVYEALERKT